MSSRPWSRPSAFSGPWRHDPHPAAGPPRPAETPVTPVTLEEIARQELAPQFRLDRVLARGTGSIVCSARECEGDRVVAVRILRRPRLDTRLDTRLRELAVTTALDHPHIVPMYRAGTTARLVWYSMKPVEGRSLAALLAQQGPLDLPATLRVAEQVANALAYAHRRGVAHGDLRPANVLLDRDWVLVTDFAVGRLLDRYGVRDHPSGPSRTPYRAPEEGLGAEPTQAGDQYALAATIWACLTGAPPAEGREPVPPPTLPRPLADALLRALRPHPTARFASVLEFAAALVVPETPAYVPPPRRPPSAGQRVLLVDDPPRLGRPVAAAAVLMLAVVAGLSVVALPSPRQRPVASAGPVAAPPALPAGPVAAPQRAVPARTLPPLPPIERQRPDPPPETRRAETTTATRTPARPTAPAPPVVQGSGTLVISSMPWGHLYVDGQPAGTTPNAGLSLPAGTHRVEIVRSGYHPFRVEVHVGPGQEVRLVNIVLEAVTP